MRLDQDHEVRTRDGRKGEKQKKHNMKVERKVGS